MALCLQAPAALSLQKEMTALTNVPGEQPTGISEAEQMGRQHSRPGVAGQDRVIGSPWL